MGTEPKADTDMGAASPFSFNVAIVIVIVNVCEDGVVLAQLCDYDHHGWRGMNNMRAGINNLGCAK